MHFWILCLVCLVSSQMNSMQALPRHDTVKEKRHLHGICQDGIKQNCHAEDKCAQSNLCTNITDTIWQSLLDNLLSYGQGSADITMTNDAVDAVNTTYYIVQPGVGLSHGTAY